MPERITVAVAQIAPQLGDLNTNLAKHRHYIEQARAAGVDLLLFPELSLTGYSLGRTVPDVAMALDDERLLALADAAADMAVAVGLVERAGPGIFYNGHTLLRQGEVKHHHRKLNLPTYGGLEEGKWYTKGSELEPVEALPGWRSHTLICADLWNPALPHLAMLDQPSLLLAPVNSATDIVSDEFSNPSGWRTNTDFIAMTYGVPVLMANSCAREGNSQFWGGSRILDPRGECLAQAGSDEQLITATLSLATIEAARFDLPTIRDADNALVARLLQRHL